MIGIFVDSNIFLYTFTDIDAERHSVSKQIIRNLNASGAAPDDIRHGINNT